MPPTQNNERKDLLLFLLLLTTLFILPVEAPVIGAGFTFCPPGAAPVLPLMVGAGGRRGGGGRLGGAAGRGGLGFSDF